jgi:hypothetical protein
MSSKTDVANQALGRIGAKTIMDLDDEANTFARVVKNVYELSVRELARSHPWNCLKARQNLAQLTAEPEFGFTYQYQLPTDCVRLLTVNGYDPGSREDVFLVEGRKILTDAEEAKITFIKYQDDPSQYDPLMVEALVVLLASKISITIRQDEGLARSFKEEYERIALPKARRSDGQEDTQPRVSMTHDSLWIRSRRISTNG